MSLSDSIARRLALLARTSADPDLRALELAVCAADPVHFVNNWGWTYDPRGRPTNLPFDLFPRQEELLRWLAEREARQEDGLVEKSREVGLTWLCVAYAAHGWLFRDGFAAGFGSRKLDLVDKIGDPDSIFDKLRFFVANLPGWMLPAGFRRSEHDGYCKLLNPANGATITGEGGDNIGRGGRKTIYFVDEAAFLERPELVERSMSNATNVRIDVSTPNGPGNPFAVKRLGGKVAVFTLHWKSDPRKGQAWYDKMRATKDPVTVAQEIDIDYTASIEGITIPAAWVRAAVGLQLPKGGKVVAGFDVGEEGPDLCVVVARAGPVVTAVESWGRCNTTESAWRARDHLVKMGAAEVCYDAGGPGMGVKGAWNSAPAKLPFETLPVQFGAAPTGDKWPDKQTSAEKFVNLRAEMWWKLRVRFEKAFEYRKWQRGEPGGVQHATADMISIPDHPQLIAELSLPLTERTEGGKIKLESKEKMGRRGVKSPDFGDALALCFSGVQKRKLWVHT